MKQRSKHVQAWTFLEAGPRLRSGPEGKVDLAILRISGAAWESQGPDIMVTAAVTPALERKDGLHVGQPWKVHLSINGNNLEYVHQC